MNPPPQSPSLTEPGHYPRFIRDPIWGQVTYVNRTPKTPTLLMPGNRSIDTVFHHLDEKDIVGKLFTKLATDGLTGHPSQVADWKTIEILLVDLLRVVREDRAYMWKVTGTESPESLEAEVCRRIRHHFTTVQSRITVDELNAMLRQLFMRQAIQRGLRVTRPVQLAPEPIYEPRDYRDAGVMSPPRPVPWWQALWGRTRALFGGSRALGG